MALTDSVKIQYYPELLDISLVESTGLSHNFPLHTHNSFIIGKIVEGDAVLIVKKNEYYLNKDSLYFINPFEPHKILSKNNSFSHTAISLPICVLTSLWQESRLSKFKVSVPTDSMLSENISKIFDLIKSNGISIEKLKDLFQEALRNYLMPSQEFTSYDILKVRNKVNNSITDILSLEDIANFSKLNTYYFSHKFTKQSGISPYRFLLQEKIKYSQKLLLGGYSISDVTYLLNFTDQSHFTNVFRNQLGISPGKFIKSNFSNY